MAKKKLSEILGKIKQEEASEPNHEYAFVESITRIPLVPEAPLHNYGAIRVWREERTMDDTYLSNQDLFDEAKKFHPAFGKEIAVAISKLPRVTAVEWTDAQGCGGVIYVTW